MLQFKICKLALIRSFYVGVVFKIPCINKIVSKAAIEFSGQPKRSPALFCQLPFLIPLAQKETCLIFCKWLEYAFD